MKLLMLGSDGELEVTVPVSDDERRDLETHIRGQFGASLIFQSKSTTYIEHRFQARHVSIYFSVARDRLISHPLFWYFFAYLDKAAMSFGEPVFIVPSEEVHGHAAPHLDADTWRFNFGASLEPDSHDRWRAYQVGTTDVGSRVLHILRTLPANLTVPADASGGFTVLPGSLWVKTT